MYLLDPFYQAACAGIADGLHSLAAVAPDQFQQSEYYLSYFRSVVGRDELQFMVNVDDGCSVYRWGARRRSPLKSRAVCCVCVIGCWRPCAVTCN